VLTDTKLRNLKPKDSLYKVPDRDGMYVAVTPAGAISFRYNYSINGRQETLSALKEKGWSVADELGQGDLTGAKYSPEASQLLTLLSDNIRSPRRIAEFVQRYYEALEAAGDPSQGSIFGDGGNAPGFHVRLQEVGGQAQAVQGRECWPGSPVGGLQQEHGHGRERPATPQGTVSPGFAVVPR